MWYTIRSESTIIVITNYVIYRPSSINSQYLKTTLLTTLQRLNFLLSIAHFTITEILARSLANFYCQQADRDMKFIIYAILTQRARAENLKSRSVTF